MLYAPSEGALRHMVGSPRLQRWMMYEWHYSAIDRPYFMRSEMQVGPAISLQAGRAKAAHMYVCCQHLS